MRNDKFDNELFFTCSIIEYIGRLTKNKRAYIVNMLGSKGIDFIYEFADVLHSENIDAVADELIRDYKIVNGTFDNVKECEEEGYRVPSFWDIGKVYMRLIMPLCNNEFNSDKIDVLIEVYNSYIAKCIDDYVIGFYFSSPECIYESYKAGEMLTVQVTGEEIAATLEEEGVKHLIRNYKIYHTVDPMYVLEDCQDYLGIKLFNGFD